MGNTGQISRMTLANLCKEMNKGEVFWCETIEVLVFVDNLKLKASKHEVSDFVALARILPRMCSDGCLYK